MKILQVNKFFWRKGGSEAYLFDLIKLLESHGHEVAVFSMADRRNESSPYGKYFVSNINYDESGDWLGKFGRMVWSSEAKKKMEELIKEFKPDIVHLHNIAHQISPSILRVFRKYKIPVVQTLHDYKLICPNYRLYTEGAVCERCRKHKYYNAFLHRCIRNSYAGGLAVALEMSIHKFLQVYEKNVQRFIAPSFFINDKLISWGIDKKKITQLYNFINSDEFKANERDDGYILYFGRLEEEKGIFTLCRAMHGLKDIKLKIAGEGNLKDMILKTCGSNVELVGYKSGAELKEIISRARFVALPSEWYENNPRAVLEANALGKPIIGANIGGIPELVKNGERGLLFRPGDVEDLKTKIRSLYDDNVKVKIMGNKAREWVSQGFTAEKHYEALIGIYRECLGV